MTTQIYRDFDFLAAVHFEGQFLMNQYSITLTMDVETDSIREQNIAMDRLKYLVHESLDSSVFVFSEETKVIEKYQAAGMKVSTTPEEPYDQIITLLLFHKFNAITENRLHVSYIQLDSQLSDGVGFMLDDDMLAASPYQSGWWTENSITTSEKIPGSKKEKIVKLVKKSDWASLDLDWKEKNTFPSEIIFSPEVEK